jgi:hypothetical protein
MISAIHELGCRCWRCIANELGGWFDQLGGKTEAGEWQIFQTISYRNSYLWPSGSGCGMPSVEFGNHCFQDFVSQLEAQIGARVDYIVGDQFGQLHGRFHQHALLAGKGLDKYPRSALESWLRKRAGWSRALPFQRGAAYYLAKYIGRNLEDANWQVQVRSEAITRKPDHGGRVVIAESAGLPSALFHQNFPRRKK